MTLITCNSSALDVKHRRSQSQSNPHSTSHPNKHKSTKERVDEDLQRAIALSLQEATNRQSRSGYVPSTSSSWPGVSEPPMVAPHVPAPPQAHDEEDPELRAAIEASLREANAPRPSAPVFAVQEDPASRYNAPAVVSNMLQSNRIILS